MILSVQDKFINKKNLKNILVILILSLIFIISCNKKKVEESEYEVSKVETGDISLSVSKTGKVVSEDEISVYTTASQRVSKVFFKEGDNVKKGDTVVTFYPVDKNETLRKIKMKNLEIQKYLRNLRNAQELLKVGGETRVNVEDAQIALDTARLELATLQEDLSLIKDKITSPVDGVITEMTADENYKVNTETTLFKVSDSKNMKVEVSLSDSQIKDIAVNQRVEITSDSLPNGEKVEGYVSQISGVAIKSTSLDESNTTVTIKMKDPKNLKPGATINATIFYNESKGILKVPYSAVLSENQKYYVFVVDDQNKVTKKEIVVGVSDETFYEINSGISAGDKIVSIVDETLKDGQTIKIYDPTKEKKKTKTKNRKKIENQEQRSNGPGGGGPGGPN